MRKILKKIIPQSLFKTLQPLYHYILAFLGAVIYRFPSKKIHIVAITGTKGKSTTTELVNAILEEAGIQTALAGTIRFKIGKESRENKHKMTMPGRFFLQHFLREAVDAGCTHAVIEMSSEGAKQFRHKFIDMDALIFTNLAPEHIESHGSFEKYRNAKLSLGKALQSSSKKRKVLVVNRDDKSAGLFLALSVDEQYTYSLKDVEPYTSTDHSTMFTHEGMTFRSHLPGEFNIYNMLGALTYAESQNVPLDVIKKALKLRNISDKKRKHSPLKKHKNAVVVDTGKLDKQAIKDSLYVRVPQFPLQNLVTCASYVPNCAGLKALNNTLTHHHCLNYIVS